MVAFGAPQLLLVDAKDPLDVGGYVMKVAYKMRRSPGLKSREIIEREIMKHFAKTSLHRVGPWDFLSEP